MQRAFFLITAISIFMLTGCGEEYFSTPQKTLEHYVNARFMTSRQEYEACLNSFRREDRKWWNERYMKMCTAFYDRDCPGEGITTETTIWVDRFEPMGPSTTNVESAEVDEKAGTALLVVDGQDIEFVKERGNWKIKGFFGVQEQLIEEYPQLQ